MSDSVENDIKPYLFEVSWEVCNKVGGIYEVIVSKILQAQEAFGDNYFLIGPDLKRNPDFEETDEPIWNFIRPALAAKELKCRLGRWNIPGNPKVILVDFSKRHNNQLFFELWERFGVDSLSGGFDYQEPVYFSYTCGEVISAIWRAYISALQAPTTAHFHEWMCGAGLLATKVLAPEIGTVFTTHATMLGRAMASTDVDIYKLMGTINPKQQAAAYNIIAKCSMESISAREADCFTTVSQITAEEAKIFLGRTPDVVTTNGLDLSIIHDYSVDREYAKKQRERFLPPVEKLLRRKLGSDLKVFTISGRYEYHNKGINLFLEALADLDKHLAGSDVTVLVLCLVMGGHHGINPQATSGEEDIKADYHDPEAGFISPFYVYDEPNDSILNACQRLGLHNRKSNKVQVVFVPAMLDGQDGFFDMEYFEILAGCDLGVFPSWYEPWGYTPHESAAFGVPTVTTDLSGFGRWTKELEKKLDLNGKAGVSVLSRHSLNYKEVSKDLEKVLLEYSRMSEEEMLEYRKNARAISAASTWDEFYPFYIEAYAKAHEKSSSRGTNLSNARKKEFLARVLTASSSTTPLLRKFTAVAELPENLSRLRELATNMWWAWQTDAKELFSKFNPKIWRKSHHNPILAIEQADLNKLKDLSEDDEYMSLYQRLLEDFDEYMAQPIKNFTVNDKGKEILIDEHHPVAYFCCEFGIHGSLPIYSGGLGVLAGDHMKSASDLAFPLIGIGLLYRNGYFIQNLDSKGKQIAVYPYNDFSVLPVEPVQDAEGNQVIIDIEMPGRVVHVAAWMVQVGRAKLYLLDTDIPKNSNDDRQITSRLYEADRDIRLRQEIVLGMAGVRLCYRLGLEPSVFHMNEGHSAFLILERIRKHQFENHMTLEEAMEFVRGSCVFTTHTPVDAGNERFDVSLVERYFSTWAQSVGMSWQDFLCLGKIEGHNSPQFDMTILALTFSNKSNAVSWLHGDVSRRMWRGLWKGLALAEIPIGHITNGIHTPSFVGAEFDKMLDTYVGKGWSTLSADNEKWNKVYDIPNDIYWEARLQQKKKMIDKLKRIIPFYMEKYLIPRKDLKLLNENLDPKTLVIGFARRFAPYKRATLLFADPDRLARIINQAGKPVIFIFAGKSHPADEKGIELIQEIIQYSQDPRFMGKIFFAENYSLTVSKPLVQGCDVWLNTPRRPYEASGTSGQKVPVNGGINFSISDGWWCEGYDAHKANGWTIGPVVNEENLRYYEQDDYADAESLYQLLEEVLIPTYYDQDENGISNRWINISKNSLKTLTAEYSSHRMVSDYMEKSYLPTAERHIELEKEDYSLTRSNVQWRNEVASKFNAVKITDIQISGIQGDTLICGQPFHVKVQVVTGEIPISQLNVQLVIGTSDGEDFDCLPEIIRLTPGKEVDGKVELSGMYIATKNGKYAYGIRVMPTTRGLSRVDSTHNLLWG